MTSSISFSSLSSTPSIFVIKINLLAFNDFATAPAAVSPFILYVWLSFKPKGEILGTIFFLIIFWITSLSISDGFPTNPSSLDSGIIFITLFFLVWIEIPSVFFFFKESTMSLLKSIRTSSTILIIFLSVTLKPLINFDWIFDLSNSLLILGPPPWITAIERPNLFKTLISSIKLLNIFLSIKTFPPYFITIKSFLYLSIYFWTLSMDGPSTGSKLSIFIFILEF